VLSRGGEIFMLEMGQPVRILDLAERMIRLSGCQVGIDIPIEITGIRPGEKLNEVLSTPDEEVLPTSHPYINRLVPIRADSELFESELAKLEASVGARDQGAVRSLLFNAALVPESTPAVDATAPADEVIEVGFEWPKLVESKPDTDQVSA
jgi:FlaA1/EpsC-like NDP-sugar epimerase